MQPQENPTFTFYNRPLSDILLEQRNERTRASSTDELARGVDTRSGSLVVTDDDGNTITLGVISDGSIGMEVADSAGNILFNPLTTDVTAINAKLGSGTSTPDLNEVLVGNGTGTSVWTTTLAGLTFTQPTIGNFVNATHTHLNNAGGGTLTVAAVSGAANMVTAPASASSTGTAGQIAYDSSFFYVCVATDTWKRVGISTW